MTYYDWDKIVSSKSDSELKKIYNDRSVEPDDKVNAVIAELKKRKILDDNETVIEKKVAFEQVIDIENIKETRPNKKRALTAQYLIWIILFLEIISIYSSYLQYNLLTAFQNGEYMSVHMAESNDLREQIIAIIYTAFFIISAITFIMWFRRAYFNLHNRISNCEYSEGWASGGWFVPIICLFRPIQIMNELWNKTNKILKERTQEHFVKTATAILGVWWAIWIISSFVGNYILRTAFDAESVGDIISGTVGDMILSIIGIPLALITIFIIKTYSNNEEKMYSAEHNKYGSTSVIITDQN